MTKNDLYMVALGLAVGVVITVLVMGAEFVHLLTRTQQIGGY